MALILNRTVLRVVERDERGRVVYRKRYRRGDEVDTSHMEESRVKHFQEKGVLVDSEDDLDEPESAGATSPTGTLVGAATTRPDGTTVPEDEQVEADGDFADENAEDEDDTSTSEDEHDVDAYDAMDYAELQQAAKAKGLNAGGSADDLRARLRG